VRPPRIPQTAEEGSRFKTQEGCQLVRAWEARALAQMPCQVRARTIATRFGDTHVLEAGPLDGPPLVLLHGIGLSAASFWLQIPELARTYRVFAPDVIGGAGRSAAVVPPSKDGSALWLVDLLDALGLETAAFVGHSLGGWMTLQLAALPDGARRIGSAVLIASSGITRVSPLALWTLGRALFGGGRSAAERFTRALMAPGKTPEPLLVEMFEAILGAVKPPLVVPWTYSRSQLEALAAPVVVLAGEHEFLFADDVAEKAKANIPSLRRVEVIAGVGHGLIWEEPRRLNKLILDALDA
jgi:pimeloyl-ACP methyl ester carboxylesterase